MQLQMCDSVGFNVCVVLPASGSGERMNLPSPKQYSIVLDKPLITFTLYAFNRIPWVEHIIVTVSAQFIPLLQELITEHGFSRVSVVEGATTRHRSIYSGIRAISRVCAQPEVVLIHDGVRVFADPEVVKNVAVAAHKHGAAGLVRPLVSTVIAADSDNYLEESLDRTKYRASEMPQAFRYEVIKSAYEKITDYDLDYGTECLHLALKYTGTKAYLLEGPSNLWKVTHKKDLYAVTGMLKEEFLTVLLSGITEQSLKETISKKVEERGMKILLHDENDKNLGNVTGVVCFHAEMNIENIQKRTNEIVSQVTCARNSICYGPITNIAVVHIVQNRTNLYGQYETLVDGMQTVAKKMKSAIYVSSIFYKLNSCKDRLAEMIVSLLWERNPVFTGQVFHLSD